MSDDAAKPFLNSRLRNPMDDVAQTRGSKPDMIGGVFSILAVIVALATLVFLLLDWQGYKGA